MMSKFWNRFSLSALAGLIFLSLSVGAVAQKGASKGPANLPGTWIVTVQQRDCQTGAALGNPFESLLTFARGGTMTETTSNPAFFPSERGPGHGVWNASSANSYHASSIAMVTGNGALTMTQVITQTIKMSANPDEFETVKASVKFFDLSGNLLRSGCATATGQRFK